MPQTSFIDYSSKNSLLFFEKNNVLYVMRTSIRRKDESFLSILFNIISYASVPQYKFDSFGADIFMKLSSILLWALIRSIFLIEPEWLLRETNVISQVPNYIRHCDPTILIFSSGNPLKEFICV